MILKKGVKEFVKVMCKSGKDDDKEIGAKRTALFDTARDRMDFRILFLIRDKELRAVIKGHYSISKMRRDSVAKESGP